MDQKYISTNQQQPSKTMPKLNGGVYSIIVH